MCDCCIEETGASEETAGVAAVVVTVCGGSAGCLVAGWVYKT